MTRICYYRWNDEVPFPGCVTVLVWIFGVFRDPFTSSKRRILFVLEDTVLLNFSAKEHLGEICSERIFPEKVCIAHHQPVWLQKLAPTSKWNFLLSAFLQFLRRCWQIPFLVFVENLNRTVETSLLGFFFISLLQHNSTMPRLRF